jgi:hypothetical protein
VKEIARKLDLGVGTVKVHLPHAYTALGVHNRVEAISRAGLFAQGDRGRRDASVQDAGTPSATRPSTR